MKILNKPKWLNTQTHKLIQALKRVIQYFDIKRERYVLENQSLQTKF